MSSQAVPLLDGVQMATLIVRVADLATSVRWYSEKLGLVPLHQGADGNTPPYAVYDVGGVVLTIWELWPGQHRDDQDSDRNSYVILLYDGDLTAVRQHLLAAGVRVDTVRESKNNRFLWLYDSDGNRWELAQPRTDEQRLQTHRILAR